MDGTRPRSYWLSYPQSRDAIASKNLITCQVIPFSFNESTLIKLLQLTCYFLLILFSKFLWLFYTTRCRWWTRKGQSWQSRGAQKIESGKNKDRQKVSLLPMDARSALFSIWGWKILDPWLEASKQNKLVFKI